MSTFPTPRCLTEQEITALRQLLLDLMSRLEAGEIIPVGEVAEEFNHILSPVQ